MIIIGDAGEIMASLSTNINYIMKPTTNEAMALRKSMELCSDLGFTRVIYEGDLEVVINATNSNENIYTNYETLLHDTRIMLERKSGW